jgi:cytochrome c oxidase subunit 2
MWKFQHPEGAREINHLHVPVGQPIRLTMTSEDVIHSFFVPAFRVKQDVIPGRYSSVWFEATRTGTFRLNCAEYCGAEHSLMGGAVTVMEPREYEAWLAGGAQRGGQRPSMAESGEELFRSLACDTCHRPGSVVRAPELAGLYGSTVRLQGGESAVADEAYLREAILDPAARLTLGYDPVMPTYRGQIGEEELLSLIQYIRSLAGATP